MVLPVTSPFHYPLATGLAGLEAFDVTLATGAIKNDSIINSLLETFADTSLPSA